jgi:hypothetical protein
MFSRFNSFIDCVKLYVRGTTFIKCILSAEVLKSVLGFTHAPVFLSAGTKWKRREAVEVRNA